MAPTTLERNAGYEPDPSHDEAGREGKICGRCQKGMPITIQPCKPKTQT